MKFLIRRSIHSAILLVCVSVLSLTLVSLAPGDYFDSMRVNPQISDKTIAALRSQHGLDASPVTLYRRWVTSAFAGEWGFSFAYNLPAWPILWPRACSTLLLAAFATLLAWVIALPGGVLAAARGGWVDGLADALTAILLGVPELIIALLLLTAAVRTSWLPAGGMMSAQRRQGIWNEGRDVLRHLVLPGLCLALGLLPLLFAHVRAAMVEVLQSPYITAARSFGIPFRRILGRHALRAALNPMISLFGLSLGLLMSSSLLVEAVFSWPGLGQLLLEAIRNRDVFLIVDSAVLAATFLVLGNFVSDVLLFVSDPRIRLE